MKIKGIILLIGMYVMLLTACVDYQAIMEQQTGINTNAEESAILGDVNGDGRIETLSIDGSIIRLVSGSSILMDFEPNSNINYLYASPVVIDIDGDEINEIVVFAATDSESTSIVFASIYVIDVNNQGEYYSRELPTELATIYSTSGINADICAKDKFLYEIKCKDKEFIIDASRIYGLSTITIEDKEKLDQKWEDIISNNYKGEVVGIVKSEIITEIDGQRCLRLYELVRGADGLDIGYIIFEVSFDKNGAYAIEDISFMERTDVQP